MGYNLLRHLLVGLLHLTSEGVGNIDDTLSLYYYTHISVDH